MVIRVLEPDLDRVVVHVADGNLGFGARQPHALELQVGHGAGGVLRERLVDADGDLAPRNQFA